jgi:hypothetical protein
LVEIYSIGKPDTFLIKNVGILAFGEQQLVTNFASCFIILAHDDAIVKRLMEVH